MPNLRSTSGSSFAARAANSGSPIAGAPEERVHPAPVEASTAAAAVATARRSETALGNERLDLIRRDTRDTITDCANEMTRLRPASGALRLVARGKAGLARVPKTVWFVFLFLGAGLFGAAAGAWRNLCTDCPSIAQIYTYEPRQTSKIYSRDGQLVAEIGAERRTPVSLSSLPPYVPQAFIAIEDRRFYSHNGLDWRGISRAILEALRNRSLSGGGGSTITQQLARNMWTERLGFEKRVVRKLKEWQVAIALENAYTKDQIIEAYVNQIGLAHGWYGIQTASRNYFGKNATDMNPAEAALLAAVANLPERYTPLRHPEAAKQRRDLVLTLMGLQGYLEEADVERWKAEPVPTERARTVETRAPYFVEWVRVLVDNRFGNQLLNNAGLKIHTTLDLDMQLAAETAMANGWSRIEAWSGYAHPTYREFSDSTADGETGNLPYVQGMFVAADPVTGHVRAMIGGRDFGHSKFNRATQALRQAGSSFKPFVYAAALENGISASEMVLDGPVVLDQADGTTWRPSNFNPEFAGWITIREGLRRSINMVSIKTGMRIGLESVAQMARRLGIRTEVEPYPSTTLGAAEVIAVQMLEAYATLATLGERVRPFPITRVENADGQILWAPQPERDRAVDPAVARLTVSLLEDVVDNPRGTGHTGVRVLAGLPREVPVAGKTGTTNEGSDIWFIGFTPNLVAAVWFGMEQPLEIVEGATGGRFASPVWGEFAKRVYYGSANGAGAANADGLSAENRNAGGESVLDVPLRWPWPEGVVTRRIDAKTGTLASRWCPDSDAYDEHYLPGTEPTKVCDREGGSP